MDISVYTYHSMDKVNSQQVKRNTFANALHAVCSCISAVCRLSHTAQYPLTVL